MQNILDKLGWEDKAVSLVSWVVLSIFIFVFVAFMLVWLLRALRPNLNVNQKQGRGGRPQRLAITDSFSLDRDGRKLIIIRRDNAEHLILIGGSNDILIEANIMRAGRDRARSPSEAENLENQLSFLPEMPQKSEGEVVSPANGARIASSQIGNAPSSPQNDLRFNEQEVAANEAGMAAPMRMASALGIERLKAVSLEGQNSSDWGEDVISSLREKAIKSNIYNNSVVHPSLNETNKNPFSDKGKPQPVIEGGGIKAKDVNLEEINAFLLEKKQTNTGGGTPKGEMARRIQEALLRSSSSQTAAVSSHFSEEKNVKNTLKNKTKEPDIDVLEEEMARLLGRPAASSLKGDG